MWVIAENGDLINLDRAEVISIVNAPEGRPYDWQIEIYVGKNWYKLCHTKTLHDAEEIMKRLADRLQAYTL